MTTYTLSAAQITAFSGVLSANMKFAPELATMTTTQLVTEAAGYAQTGHNASLPATDTHFGKYDPVYEGLIEATLYKIATTGHNGALTAADITGFANNLIANLSPTQQGWVGLLWQKTSDLLKATPVYVTKAGIDVVNIWADQNS